MKLVFTMPGEWTSPGILLRLMEVVDAEWQATEDGFASLRTGAVVSLAMGGAMRGLERVFGDGGDPTRPPLDDALLAEIARHKTLVQVSLDADPDAPLDSLVTALSATNAILDGGGLGVHVATSGLAHGADAFQVLYQALDTAAEGRERMRALAALVVRYRLGARSTTLGMHALGRPDVVLTTPLDEDRAVAALERAAFGPGGEVQPDDRGHPEILHNPFGVIAISR